MTKLPIVNQNIKKYLMPSCSSYSSSSRQPLTIVTLVTKERIFKLWNFYNIILRPSTCRVIIREVCHCRQSKHVTVLVCLTSNFFRNQHRTYHARMIEAFAFAFVALQIYVHSTLSDDCVFRVNIECTYVRRQCCKSPSNRTGYKVSLWTYHRLHTA